MISSPLVHLIPLNARITLKLSYRCVRRSDPVKFTKVEGRSTNITFLGIVINTTYYSDSEHLK